MKIEDCEVGMKLECLEENYPNGFHKGDILTVKEIINKAVRFEESHFTWNICSFEPANKFEVGDEVVYYNGLFKVWGYVYNNILKKYNYALKNDDEEVTIAVESQLSPLKKKDELEVGDKFKIKTAEGKTNRINEVLGVFKDDKYNQIKYVAKRVQGDWEGYVDIYNSEMIDEIIYE